MPNEAENSQIREVSFSFLSDLLCENKNTENHRYWIESASAWAKTAVLSHLKNHLTIKNLPNDDAETILYEYLREKGSLMFTNHISSNTLSMSITKLDTNREYYTFSICGIEYATIVRRIDGRWNVMYGPFSKIRTFKSLYSALSALVNDEIKVRYKEKEIV